MNDSGSQTAADIYPASGLARSDAELVRGCRAGSQAAWDELVARYQRLIYAIPRRAGLNDEQAADIFQDVFLTLFEKIDELTVRLEKEFGGNSGGIRQAVNRIDGNVDGLHSYVTELARDYEHLRGRYDQHIDECVLAIDMRLHESDPR